MSDEKKNPGHRWEPGHSRYGGRKKNTAAMARAMAEEMGVDPLRFLMECIQGTVTRTIVENGKRKRVSVEIPLELSIDCAKHVSRFCYPVLSAAAVQAEVSVDVDAQVALPIDAILRNPQLADALGDLALMMAEAGPDGQPRNLLPSPDAEYQ